MTRLPRTIALSTALCLAPAAPAAVELREPCKNHYILRCEHLPEYAWEALPAPLMAHAYAPTATLLADGRVLVVGGYETEGHDWRSGEDPPRSGAEIYDPLRREWQPTAPMNALRAGHQAVRLADGRVMVIGGEATSPRWMPHQSVEIFDPATGVWTAHAGLRQPRRHFSATLLADGSVLVVGGHGEYSDSSIATAERWEPSTSAWMETGALRDARLAHTATALPDGRLLVVGGMLNDFWMDTIGAPEIYDPATGTWSEAGTIGPRWAHTATLTADGQVLVAGGYISRPWVPGFPSESDVASSAVFDPATNAWREAGRLHENRYGHIAVALPDGGVLVIGGWTQTAQAPRFARAPVVSFSRYTGEPRKWARAFATTDPPAELSQFRFSSVALPDGSVFVLGGEDGRAALRLRD